jgi:cyanophycinase
MSGYFLLEGGAEFGGRMADPDRRAIELAGGWDALLVVIPAAAAPDHNHQRAGANAERWFTSLGARQVRVLPLIDRRSADQPEIAQAMQEANLIYMLGGFPGHLAQALLGSASLAAMQAAFQNGAVVGGSSAGAMVMCEKLYDPRSGELMDSLGFLPGACLIPHHNTFGKNWARSLAQKLPGMVLIGIDERTGMLNDGPGGAWQVYGQGNATVYRDGAMETHLSGATWQLG